MFLASGGWQLHVVIIDDHGLWLEVIVTLQCCGAVINCGAEGVVQLDRFVFLRRSAAIMEGFLAQCRSVREIPIAVLWDQQGLGQGWSNVFETLRLAR
jgi:hypothetical protein